MSGESPKGWVKTSTGDLISFITSGSRGWAKYYSEKGATFLRVGNLDRLTLDLDLSNVQCVSPPDGAEGRRTQVQPNDILISITADVGMVGVVPTDFGEAYVNQHIALARPSNGTNPNFLAWYLVSGEGQERLGERKRGATKAGLGLEDIRTVKIPFPPANEQRRIVEKIDACMARSGRAKEALDTILALLDQYRQSVLAAAFRGDLSADWREKNGNLAPIEEIIGQLRMRCLENARSSRETTKITAVYGTPEERASDSLPNGWAYIRLEKLAPSFNYGTSKKSNPSGKVPVLRMGNIQNGELDWSDLVFTSNSAEIEKYSLKSGDVLFNRTNSPELVGKTAVYHGDRPAVYAGYLIRIRTFEELNPEYLAFCLNSPMGRDYCWRVKSDGVSQSNINAKKLAAFEVPLCSKDEQTIIVHRIKSLFSVIDNVRLLVDEGNGKNRVLTNSILAKAFRGELVPQDPNDEPASVLLERIRTEREAAAAKTKRGRKKTTPKGTKSTPTKRKNTMGLKRTDVPDDCLTQFLTSCGGNASAEELWQQSELDIDEFYKQLRDEMKAGRIREGKSKQYLELANAA